MKIYYERNMTCSNCGRSQRQTATMLPLDWIGQSIERMRERDFKRGHGKKCGAPVTYSPWKIGQIYDAVFKMDKEN